MRKAYEQPKLYAESFELLEHISACSGYAPGLTTARSADAGCSYDFDGVKLFSSDFGNNCEEEGGSADGDELMWNVVCYNNPDGGINGHPFGS